MSEAGGSNVEIAHHLSEPREHLASFGPKILELVEALILVTVAIATAWSGYEAELWTGRQSKLYGEAAKLRVQAEGMATTANQERLYNAATVVEWLRAEAHGEKKLADLCERRFLPEFRPAFEAWKRTDPVHNPNAPVGPQSMAEFRTSKGEEAVKLNDQAAVVFDQGTESRRFADEYVWLTVILATVLLLTAIGRRFKIQAARAGLAIVALSLLLFSLYQLFELPRLT